MESMGLGAISEEEWRSLSGMYTVEENDFMAQLLTSFPIDDELDEFSNSGIPSIFCSSDIAADSRTFSHFSPIYVANNIPMSMDFCMENTTSNDLPEPNKNSELKRSPSSGDVHVQKNRRKSRSKKNKNNGKDSNDGCSSEDDSNASKGSATDHQSLYARKRRERINEKLKILQNLVPNGTKVDMSTMLEEAVQYVKFLQLQIKMLSSNDLWMYSPIAYNGMDIGLNLNLAKQRCGMDIGLNLNLAKQRCGMDIGLNTKMWNGHWT